MTSVSFISNYLVAYDYLEYTMFIFSYSSAAKAPYLARFQVRRCGIKELEKQGMAVSSGLEVSPNIGPLVWQAAIFKVRKYGDLS